MIADDELWMREDMAIKLGVSGAAGRMGKRIIDLAFSDQAFEVVLALENKEHPEVGSELIGIPITSSVDSIAGVDCLIDFSSPDATMEHLKAVIKFKKPIVIGTTGLSSEQKKEIESASKVVPVVFSPNMSLGVNLLFELIRNAVGSLPSGYKINISEAHHVHKKDAPSGTAKFMAQIIEEVSSRKTDIESIRQGEIVGDHEVVFDSPWDTIRISHSAKTRDIFAIGALQAAKFIVKKEKGLYDSSNVLKELKRR